MICSDLQRTVTRFSAPRHIAIVDLRFLTKVSSTRHPLAYCGRCMAHLAVQRTSMCHCQWHSGIGDSNVARHMLAGGRSFRLIQTLITHHNFVEFPYNLQTRIFVFVELKYISQIYYHFSLSYLQKISSVAVVKHLLRLLQNISSVVADYLQKHCD